MVKRTLLSVIALVSLGLLGSATDAAAAQPSAPAPDASDGAPTATSTSVPAPRIHHAPLAVAKANAPLSVEIVIADGNAVKRADLVYRSDATSSEARVVPFQRASSGTAAYVAVVPAEATRGRALGYAIELETPEGRQVPAFATREEMHQVILQEDAGDARERALLARLGHRRVVVGASGEYADFGRSPSLVNGNPFQVSDSFYRIEGRFTYRLLRTVAEFGFRGGIVRGSSPVLGATSKEAQDVGMNYAAPRLRLRLVDWFHFDAEAITSVNEVGYSVGCGGAAIFGDPYGNRVTFGVEALQIFGARGYSRLDLSVLRWLALGTTVEVTNQPHADSAGVRLLASANVELGAGFTLALGSGYQARSFVSGGPAAELGLNYAF